MRILPVKLRNVEFKLILSSVDIKKFIVKSFKQDFTRRNLVDYLTEVLLKTKVIQKVNCNLLTIPFSVVRKLNKFSSSSFFTNTIERDISYMRRDEAFVYETVVNYTVQSKLITKLNGYFAIIVISKLVDQEVHKFHIYFPQLKRCFDFYLYKVDLFSAEIGLHKKAIEKGSKLNQSMDFKSYAAIKMENSEKSFPRIEGASAIHNFGRFNQKTIQRFRDEALGQDKSRSRIISGTPNNAQMRPSKINQSFNMLTIKAKITPRQANTIQSVTSNWLLNDLDDITSKNVLEIYAKYEQKALEIIKTEVLGHRRVNLKHTQECIETFAEPRTLKIESRRENFIRFYSAFYWRCMAQMLSMEERPTSLRIKLSKFEDRLSECIDSRMATIKGQLYFIGFYLYHGDGFEMAKLRVTSKTKIELRIRNISSQYDRLDILEFKDLILNIKSQKYYPYSEPNLGNLKIACSIGCRNVSKNLELHDLSKPRESIFLEKNLRNLLSPMMMESTPGLSILGITNNIPLSPTKVNDRIQDSFTRSQMNLTSRTLKSLGLAGKQNYLVLLARKLFLSDPGILLWILLEKSTGSILFAFYFTNTSQVQKRYARMDHFSDSLPYLEVLFKTCKFFEAGQRIYATIKNEFIRLYTLGTLFE